MRRAVRTGAVLLCFTAVGCGSEASTTPDASSPEGGVDTGGPERDASSESAGDSARVESGVTDTGVDAGPACGALGAPCCPGATCTDASVCTGGVCGCVQSTSCPDGGTCTAGRCLITMSHGQSGPYAIALDRTSVYWCNQGFGGPDTVVKMPLNGGAMTTLASVPRTPYESTDGLVDMAVDATSVYWVTDSGSLLSVPLAGGKPRTLVAGTGDSVTHLAVSPSTIYWTAPFSGTVKSEGLTGGAMAQVYSGGPGVAPYDIVVDATSVYWTNSVWGASLPASSLMRAPLAGGPVTTLAQWSPIIGVLTVDRQSVYWVEENVKTSLLRADLSGGATVTLASGQDEIDNLAVDAVSVYWTDSYNGTLMKVPRTGGTPITLFQGDKPYDVAVDDTSVYWTSPSGGALMRLSPK